MTGLRNSLFFSLIAAAFSFILFSKRHALIDRWKLRDYRAPERIAALAAKIELTDRGLTLFYVNRPQILSNKTEFAGDCDHQSTSAEVHSSSTTLGCYRDFDHGIFLFDISDARLKGAVEVTAAHEILHAAYDRLDEAEKDVLRPLLEEGVRLNEAKLKDRMKPYEGREPELMFDELHSILGTEVADLPSGLELHYARYFANRSAIVTTYGTYEKEFRERGEKIDEYDKKLAILREEIEGHRRALETEAQALTDEQRALEDLARQQRVEEHNSRAQAFNFRASAYNEKVAAARDLIARHNELVTARNGIALETQELAQAIDSRLKKSF